MFAVLILQLCPPIEYCNLIHQQKGRKAQQNRSYQASRNLRGRGKKRGRERGRLPWGNPPRHAVLRRRACRCGKGFREPFTPRKLRVPRAWDRDTGQEEEETPKVRDAPARRRPAEEGTRSLSGIPNSAERSPSIGSRSPIRLFANGKIAALVLNLTLILGSLNFRIDQYIPNSFLYYIILLHNNMRLMQKILFTFVFFPF